MNAPVPARVLVTGAASGIGAATVARFRADGARVAGIDMTADGLAAIDLDHRAVADVTNEEIAAAVDDAASVLGGLDTVVCCAGVAVLGTVEAAVEGWDRTFAVNVRGSFLVARASLPHLRSAGGGSIVLIGSNLGLVAGPGAAAYCASKGAIIQLTRAMAMDHGPEGIRVNCVCPGVTETPMSAGWLAASGDPAGTRTFLEQHHLHGRFIRPEEIANGIAFLASPEASSVMGVAFPVDAGYTIR